MKYLKDIIRHISIIKIINDENKPINELQLDSRKIVENDVFFAIKGVEIDGHLFIEKAIEKGAKTIVCEEIPQETKIEITYLQVQNVSESLGLFAKNYYDNPTSKFKLIGITGTNGKTSCSTLLFDLFTNLGYVCALISTVENRVGNQIIPSTHTTPDSITLNKLFVQAVQTGCDYVFMEVSSHGIHQNRLAGLSFDVAGFTNITHDHLDYHKTFAEYRDCKKRFFDELSKDAVAITNIDDKNGSYMLQNSSATQKSYALKTLADYKGKILESRIDGLFLNFNETEFWTSLTGNFNAYNALLVFAIACELGVNSMEVITELSKIKTVKGRFQTFISDTKITAVVDYAHTPDALENVLETINQIRTRNETLITVFGCGGNRDKEKRPEMGKIATRLSDKVIITSDNPRTEKPEDIIDEIKQGVEGHNFNKFLVIPNREEAIKTAISIADSKDIVVIAGKGHENYQEINGIKTPFDDYEITKSLFKLMKK
jgi:UDP-N-acetylmuramoyl-L-alanyl-D-glutamate--2,6-diaminopimelate ligase